MSLIDEPPLKLRGSIDPEKLAELAKSLSSQGLLQPIRIQKTNGRFTIIAGHRRFLAAKSLGWAKIEAMVIPKSSINTLDQSLAENIHREDLTPIEEARMVHQLVNEENVDVDLVAARFAKSRAWVEGRLELLDYPADILGAIHSKQIPLTVGKEFARIADEGYRGYLLENAINNGCTARTARAWVDDWERSAAIQGEPTTAVAGPPTPYEGQPVGVGCAMCNALYPITNLRPLYTCPECIRKHYAEKAKQREGSQGGKP